MLKHANARFTRRKLLRRAAATIQVLCGQMCRRRSARFPTIVSCTVTQKNLHVRKSCSRLLGCRLQHNRQFDGARMSAAVSSEHLRSVGFIEFVATIYESRVAFPTLISNRFKCRHQSLAAQTTKSRQPTARVAMCSPQMRRESTSTFRHLLLHRCKNLPPIQ